MPLIRLRLIGSRDDADTLINLLHGIERIERVEEIDDLIPQMRDDSSSAGLIEDNEGRVFHIEIQAPNDKVADTVRDLASEQTMALGAVLEIVDEF
ncbi:MAG: hypothetical protein ABW154_10350, partial [Dyella sp.]